MKTWLLPLACLGLFSVCAQAADAPAAPPGGPDVRAACAADVKKFCAGVQPGKGRVRACITEHRDALSEGCRGALQQVRAHRPPPQKPGAQGAPGQAAPPPQPQQ